MSRSEGDTTTQSERLSLAEQGKYVSEIFRSCGDQWMKTFNYYAILVAAAITGSVAAYERCPWQIVAFVGLAHIVMAVIFFLIDIRNSRLVFNSRRAMSCFEKCAGLPETMRIVTNDHAYSVEKRTATSTTTTPANETGVQNEEYRNGNPVRAWLERTFGVATFTRAYNIAFVMQVACGVVLIVAALTLKRPLQH